MYDGKTSHTGLVIAVDGPSGSGKSTVSKQVARELGLAYLDTGAMYRCATWWVVRCGVDLDDLDGVADAVKRMPLDMPLDPDNQVIVCDGVDITQEIRTPEITRVVSKVAANMKVREELIRLQRDIISSARSGIIAEGRDITSVVAPDATVRVIITASEEARLARRSLEVRGSADKDAVEATKDEVLRRDRDDLKVNDFMTAKDGVTLIDSSQLGIDEVVSAVIALVPEA
ncbi:MAG: (d)CMP kinase [Actinomycetaceae bacterium]|nr:(d)CMP kinase [Actinomycetaceae bacterium]